MSIYLITLSIAMHTLLNHAAPDFTLQDQDGIEHSLSHYHGQYVLLYFYPKDDTPGCTTEACSIRDAMNDFQSSGVQVLGVSMDDVQSHKKFAQKYQLNFPVLADTEKEVIDMYGIWKRKKLFGRNFMGIRRDSFLIDPKGVVVKHYKKVKPAEHVEQVLADVNRR